MKQIPLIIAPSPKRSFSIFYLSEQLILASLLLIKTCHISLHNVCRLRALASAIKLTSIFCGEEEEDRESREDKTQQDGPTEAD